jgi:hypothetical protein
MTCHVYPDHLRTPFETNEILIEMREGRDGGNTLASTRLPYVRKWQSEKI